MTDDLRERVARAIAAADNTDIPEGYADGMPDDISDWDAFMADAAIAIVIKDAAKVVEDVADDGSNEAARRIRAIGGK